MERVVDVARPGFVHSGRRVRGHIALERRVAGLAAGLVHAVRSEDALERVLALGRIVPRPVGAPRVRGSLA